MLSFKPIVAITMGDAAGIGPEIIVKALSQEEIYDLCKPLVIGDAKVIKSAVNFSHLKLKVTSILDIRECKFETGEIDVLDLKNIDFDNLVMGKPNPMCGKAAIDYIRKAVELTLRGKTHAISTAPINKKAVNMAGYKFTGHTEFIAELTKTADYAMMLIAGKLKVSHVTTHMSLREACKFVRKERILKVIELTHKALKDMGINNPKIAVAALNPHSGEGGLFGKEENEEILPAVEEAVNRGIVSIGPLPADTVFVKASGGAYDAVVAMYHDQGHIPVKMVGLRWDKDRKEWSRVSGVNLTLGLPIIRTSVDHGTAYGKAGKGRANPDSMIEAIRLAAKLASQKS